MEVPAGGLRPVDDAGFRWVTGVGLTVSDAARGGSSRSAAGTRRLLDARRIAVDDVSAITAAMATARVDGSACAAALGDAQGAHLDGARDLQGRATRPEGDRVQTMPGKARTGLLRPYGPREPWFDKSAKAGDLELAR